MTEFLVARDLRKSFLANSGRVDALRGVSLSVNDGEVLAFLGPNGAGKTTAIRILTGLVLPDSGSVSVGGKDPFADPSALQHIGMVMEGNRNLYGRLTAPENLEYFAALKGMKRREARQRAVELLDQFGLNDKIKAPVQALSRGMQQKVAIALALIHRPQLVLLDEPTLGLDVEATVQVKRIIREMADAGHAVLLTTHQLDVVEDISDRVSIIRDGCIVAEEPTRSLIARFSGDSYRISVAGFLTSAQLAYVADIGGVTEGNQIVLRGQAEDVYSLLEVLRPVPLLSIERDAANLTDVFLKITRSSNDAQFVCSGV